MRLVTWLEDRTDRAWVPEDLGGGFVGLTTDMGDGFTVTVTVGDSPTDNDTLLPDGRLGVVYRVVVARDGEPVRWVDGVGVDSVIRFVMRGVR